MTKPRFPKALRKGDRVAVVSPAGPVRSRAGLRHGLARLQSWGLKPDVLPHALGAHGYLAGDDGARAADLQRGLADPDYRAVFATRGGYGCTRILERIDFRPLAADPKPLVGFSDLTALLAAAWHEARVVGLHGPMVAHGDSLAMGPDCEQLQRRLLFEGTRPPALPPDGDAVPHALRGGRAEGRLVGGNLTLVVTLLATPWQIDTAGVLLFLEDVGEAPYRIDRMLTQLRAAGVLQQCAGVVLGDFHAEDTPLASESADITAVLRDRLGDLDVPVGYGFPFGHRPRSWTLPFGARARLECAEPGGAAQLRLLEAAVR